MLNIFSYRTRQPRLFRKKGFGVRTVILLPLILAACTKQNTPPGTASLTIVNTVVGSKELVTNFNNAQPITYTFVGALFYKQFTSRFNQLSAYSGKQQLALYEFPDTTAKSIPLFNLALDLPIGSIHSLFLTGTFSKPDTLFTRDALPYYPSTDSAMGIRFVNLSPGSAPVTVNILGNANGSEAGNLSYKGITGFKNYPVRSSTADYVFEFRDAVSGALITTYTASGINNPGTLSPNVWIYRSFTLALVGVPGGAGVDAQAIFLIPHA